MTVILLKHLITEKQKKTLLKEFPQFQLALELTQDPSMIKEQCSLAEIVYGNRFSSQELLMTPQLRWIHIPSPYTDEICLEQIVDKGNILISTTKEENISQIGEFAISAILAFMKSLFLWNRTTQETGTSEKEALTKSMWRSENRTLLQIGLGYVGTEIAKRASEFGFRVIGIQDPPSFHQYCDKVLSTKDIHSVLPGMDIVSLATPRDYLDISWFAKDEMRLLKKDSILIVLGNGSVIDIPSLEEMAPSLRGILIDAHFKNEISAKSPLWSMHHVLITPEVGIYPISGEGVGFRTFLYNLRQFIHGNFKEMKNLFTATGG